MRRFTALCLAVISLLSLLCSGAFASNRYNPSDWYYIVDKVANTSFNEESPDRYYGGNCKEFVRYVCSSEDRETLPPTNGDGRTLGTLTPIVNGQWLNNEHGNRGPTSAEVKAVFANAVSGDVVQMYWGGTKWHNPHTALINDIDENGVTFFQSHMQTDSTKRCGYTVSSNYYDWETLSSRYSFDATAGGLSIYSFHNTAERRGSVRIDAENFPDEFFRNYVLENYDTNGDGILSAEEAASVSSIWVAYRGITNLKGIEYFTALTGLDCGGNQLTELDVSGCTALDTLHCEANPLTVLNVSKNTALTELWCYGNQLTALDVSKNTALTELWCYGNQLTELDVSKNTALTLLLCYENQLTTLNMSSNIALTYLDCANNQLTTINVSNNAALTGLYCSNNQLTELDVSDCPQLTDNAIGCDSGVRILRNKPRLISSLINIATNTPVSVFRLHSNVLDATAQIIEAVSQSGIITDTGKKENLHKVAKCLQVISSVYSGDFLTRFFTNILIPSIFKSPGDKGDNGYGEKFQLSESLSLNVTPGEFKTSEGTVKITLASSRDLSNDVYCMIASGDSGMFFKFPASEGSRRVFTAEFNAGELFASMDAGMIDIMCVSCISDDEGICGMLMSNTASVDWLMNDTTLPEILTETLSNAITKQSYSLQLKASGTTPITWTHTGKLPAGLSLSESGLISGTPTKAGKSSFTVTAENSHGKISKSFTIQTFDPVSITTSSLKAGTIGKSYNATMRAKGSKTITWSAEGLPDGLTINAKGKISGKPSAYGVFTVKVKAENGAGITEKNLQLEIKPIAPTLSGTLAKPTLNVPYSSGLKLSKGSTPVTWSVQGNLPGGLSLDPNTGIISGTPTSYDKSGFKVTITASNDAGIKSKKITLKVKGTSPKITAKLPQATAGENYSAELSATGSEPITFAAELPEYLTLDGNIITGIIPESEKSFKIKAYASNPVKQKVSKSYTIRVSANKSLPQNQNADNNTDITKINKGVNSGVITNVPQLSKNSVYSYSESLVIVAELGEVSRDMAGLYDFDVEIPDCIPEGSELVYISNSDEPSSDDEIAEFFDEEGNEISKVPESRKISVSIWLNPERIYKPVIAVYNFVSIHDPSTGE